MKPPYYHTLIEALSRKDRSGLDVKSDEEAGAIRRICFETSEYRDKNRSSWAEFVTTNPSDKAAQYMSRFL